MSAIDLNTDETACSAWIARFLEARSVDRIFGLQGGHIQPIWGADPRRGPPDGCDARLPELLGKVDRG
jgi:hypothetical protein